MKKTEKTTKKEIITKSTRKKTTAKNRGKSRGLWGIMKGEIHYDTNADVFNLGL